MEKIYKSLNTYPKRTILLSDLQDLLGSFFKDYDDFANTIISLENNGVLQMVKSKGRTTRTPSLAYQYRIDKSKLSARFHQEIQQYQNELHPAINLDEYYQKDPTIWQHDLPYLLKINDYLHTNGFPKEVVPAPERSFELVQDEKWITEKGGKEILERVGLFERLKITPVSDPLMFAVNPKTIHSTTQYHLIVENKTTYQGLLPALKKTEFSTLVYGSGKKVIQSIEQFSEQYPVEAEHVFFYFGDLDREGISIWYSLTKKIPAQLAMPFYEACLEKQPVYGKDYQKQYKEAQTTFIKQFSPTQQAKIEDVFSQGKYYPQEILKSKELQQIWREADWKKLTYNN
ncbi:DUF2220 domain-containing protein [Caldibacillus thermolactis]|jgi:hypothetical protein|uniref:DUF2220 domain-containing protein n=1 Tax=Pallidibacillus thermolactis TaxID=251051 RepID=A0ABT2WBZ6_9BACI|nr:DUF2220 domain-containing protein [Pallidibacillus thermolactis]MCU9593190.1 DUF2220 domain-containing protein [Pallidibacillus thermolactis]MCU9602622.1 DUF2220 domain-containing protein [Pallidibacillus thermolactis subsp. kokeshiiformis]MED1674279.1 DUF2220 domain-containing protein [Pallidibacillus thermolactis subsp. kokeshiiformis]